MNANRGPGLWLFWSKVTFIERSEWVWQLKPIFIRCMSKSSQISVFLPLHRPTPPSHSDCGACALLMWSEPSSKWLTVLFLWSSAWAGRWMGFKTETPVCFPLDLKQVCYKWLCLPGRNNPLISAPTLAQSSLSLQLCIKLLLPLITVLYVHPAFAHSESSVQKLAHIGAAEVAVKWGSDPLCLEGKVLVGICFHTRGTVPVSLQEICVKDHSDGVSFKERQNY